jgi:hypothetical protein
VNVFRRRRLIAELENAGLRVEHTEVRNFEWSVFWLLHCAAHSRFDYTGRALDHENLTSLYMRTRLLLRRVHLDRQLMEWGNYVFPKSRYVYARRRAAT